ncbi:hypothetical protein HELRODRAFT_182097 [Helobdella robusta]|uniref:Uncharacterized protein n=1 Tax=Helobdella robusta TaxID=6412 RepID=T1FHQ8_HELRO|nr:hypothetical protein HELRODRAFT_182097 [Helobdella robusta]ESN91241.1 hypothetical protein HELRODRAFT_182097 [Helobdella robusta]
MSGSRVQLFFFTVACVLGLYLGCCEFFHRDTSNVSVGDLENILETETPPTSPGDGGLLLQDIQNDVDILTNLSNEMNNFPSSPISSKPSSPVLSKFSKAVFKGMKNNRIKGNVKSEDDQARRIAEYNQNLVFIAEEHSSLSSFSSVISKPELKIFKEFAENCKDEKDELLVDEDDFSADEFYKFHTPKDVEDDNVSEKSSLKPSYRSRKVRKSGLSMVQMVREIPEFNHLLTDCLAKFEQFII